MKRLALSALLAVSALLGVASPAFAHTELVSSDPADGAVLPQRPRQLTLTFSEPVPAESAGITVTGPDGAAWPLGEVTAQGNSLVVPLKASGSPAGPHALNWRVESLDGDFVSGTITFTLPAPPADQVPAATTATGAPDTPAPTAPAATATTPPVATTTGQAATSSPETSSSAPAVADTADTADEGGGVPTWVVVVIAIVVALAAAAAVVALRRRRRDAADDTGTAG
ncbi:copper resistance CopC family protein [Saccharothrix xinjiangensis]|uniref:Copper resistance protein CopC n=1 Tax=Saccharothrix xinjiangensis TaxID=204798 RepID=A0ABV9YD87_9PSEU